MPKISSGAFYITEDNKIAWIGSALNMENILTWEEEYRKNTK